MNNVKAMVIMSGVIGVTLIACYLYLFKPRTTPTFISSSTGTTTTTTGTTTGTATTTQTTTDTQSITLATIAQHAIASNCWMAIDGSVYDVTDYVPRHPNRDIVMGCGKDATALFGSVPVHRRMATMLLHQYKIGTLAQ